MKLEDTLAWINESKMPAEMHEIAGPMIGNVKRAIQLCVYHFLLFPRLELISVSQVSAKFEAERAENVKLRKQLAKAQGKSNEVG
jgi:hypothetical protein